MYRVGVASAFLAAAMLLLVAISAQAAPITPSDIIQIRMADGVTVLESGGTAEGPGSGCTAGAGFGGTLLDFQCETTTIANGFTYVPGTFPADVGVLLTNPDGSLSDFVTVDFPTCCPSIGVGMTIYSDVDGLPFPSVAQFQAAYPNMPMTSIQETGNFQDLTSIALGLVPHSGFGGLTISPVPQISPNFTFWVQSDLAAEPVPEPATMTLTALGLAGIVTRYRRRRRSRSES